MSTLENRINRIELVVAAIFQASIAITMAVAGFSEDEIAITSEQNRLLITGNHADETDEQGEYLHRGIATRTFERRFNLADHVRVIGANLENGLLHIDLEREIPEAMKPRTIKIKKTAAHLLDIDQEAKAKKSLKSEDKAA